MVTCLWWQERLGKDPKLLSLSLAIAAAALLIGLAAADLNADGDALLAFLNGLNGASRVRNWSKATSPCTWDGVGCNKANDSVLTLKLPATGLTGAIAAGTLGSLLQLQILSLRSNQLSGPLPPDIQKCAELRKLYLQQNVITGQIPPFDVTSNPNLNVVDLSFNMFSGAIPPSLGSLRHLRILFLQHNNLTGGLPSVLSNTTQLNVANNDLEGPIPSQLQGLPSSSFDGNPGLCGTPLLRPCPNSPSPSPPKHRHNKVRLSTIDVVLIIVAGAAFTVMVGACCLLWYVRRHLPAATSSPSKKTLDKKGSSKNEIDESKEDSYSAAQRPDQNKLVFFDPTSPHIGGHCDDRPPRQLSFDLEDLLRASAEVLGKGSFGTSYKAVLEDGPTVVVKRLKETSVNHKDFEQQMDLIGKLQHRNLVPLQAYYFSKEEKLLVHEYLPLGSLANALQGGRGGQALGWEARLKAAVGAARGVAHIHGSKVVVHGDMKSANVLLHGDYGACTCDYGLAPLLLPSSARAGTHQAYRAPELAQSRAATPASDVYSLGVVILEILTGRLAWHHASSSSSSTSASSAQFDLPRWVRSVVREEWTAEVFDKELIKIVGIEEELVQLLQVGLACVEIGPDKRPHITEVVTMIEDVRPSLLCEPAHNSHIPLAAPISSSSPSPSHIITIDEHSTTS